MRTHEYRLQLKHPWSRDNNILYAHYVYIMLYARMMGLIFNKFNNNHSIYVVAI